MGSRDLCCGGFPTGLGSVPLATFKRLLQDGPRNLLAAVIRPLHPGGDFGLRIGATIHIFGEGQKCQSSSSCRPGSGDCGNPHSSQL